MHFVAILIIYYRKLENFIIFLKAFLSNVQLVNDINDVKHKETIFPMNCGSLEKTFGGKKGGRVLIGRNVENKAGRNS